MRVLGLLGAAYLILAMPGAAWAVSCSPNPNLNAPPFVDGCPVPASTLNRLFQGAYGGLEPGEHTCATVVVNATGYIQHVFTGTCSGGGGGGLMTGGTNILTVGTSLMTP